MSLLRDLTESFLSFDDQLTALRARVRERENVEWNFKFKFAQLNEKGRKKVQCARAAV